MNLLSYYTCSEDSLSKKLKEKKYKLCLKFLTNKEKQEACIFLQRVINTNKECLHKNEKRFQKKLLKKYMYKRLAVMPEDVIVLNDLESGGTSFWILESGCEWRMLKTDISCCLFEKDKLS